MSHDYTTWNHPYTPAKKYGKRVAYFSMEYGLHISARLYSGGLGILAGDYLKEVTAGDQLFHFVITLEGKF